jgi:hypothetical protein
MLELVRKYNFSIRKAAPMAIAMKAGNRRLSPTTMTNNEVTIAIWPIEDIT